MGPGQAVNGSRTGSLAFNQNWVLEGRKECGKHQAAVRGAHVMGHGIYAGRHENRGWTGLMNAENGAGRKLGNFTSKGSSSVSANICTDVQFQLERGF